MEVELIVGVVLIEGVEILDVLGVGVGVGESELDVVLVVFEEELELDLELAGLAKD